MSLNLDLQPLTPKLALREFGPSLLILLLCLAGAEALLATDAVFERLPLPKPYYSFDIARRVHDLRSLRRGGPVDVLFLGTSIVRADIDPKVFDKRLKKRGVVMTSFNAGLSAVFPPAASLYLKYLWLDAARPRFVLHGLRESELTLASPKPMHLGGMIDRRWAEGTRASLLEAAIIQRLLLLQYRGTLREVIERFRDGEALNQVEPGERTTDGRGHRRERVPLRKNRARNHKHLWKYKSAPVANRYRNSLPALEAMHEMCVEAGVTYVIVNMPEHAERFSAKHGQALWEDYQRTLRAWAKAHDVPFLDVTDGELRMFEDDKYFSDFHHMSQRGAERFSTLLADRFVKAVVKRKKTR